MNNALKILEWINKNSKYSDYKYDKYSNSKKELKRVRNCSDRVGE